MREQADLRERDRPVPGASEEKLPGARIASGVTMREGVGPLKRGVEEQRDRRRFLKGRLATPARRSRPAPRSDAHPSCGAPVASCSNASHQTEGKAPRASPFCRQSRRRPRNRDRVEASRRAGCSAARSRPSRVWKRSSSKATRSRSAGPSRRRPATIGRSRCTIAPDWRSNRAERRNSPRSYFPGSCSTAGHDSESTKTLTPVARISARTRWRASAGTAASSSTSGPSRARPERPAPPAKERPGAQTGRSRGRILFTLHYRRAVRIPRRDPSDDQTQGNRFLKPFAPVRLPLRCFFRSATAGRTPVLGLPI